MRLPIRAFDTNDQHVLSQPAFRTCLVAGDAQGMAFFAKQGVAAVARADALDREFFREMHDEAALGVEIPGRVQAFDKRAFALDSLQRGGSHTRHEFHVGNNVGAVSYFHAAPGIRRINRPHAIRNNV